MERFINRAAKAWANATLNIQKFANAYVEAVDKFGEKAVERFKVAYPMFGDREWKRLMLIGNGELLPQFFFKSDFFVGKLLKLNGSMRFQKALVGASNDGRLRVDRGNGPEKATLADLTKKEEKALILLLSEENEKLSPEELKLKYKMLVAKINKSNCRHKPAWCIRTVKGRTVAHFNRPCNVDRDDLDVLMKSIKKGRCVGPNRPYREILFELVEAVKNLEGMRDAEWGFAEDHGTDGAFWTEGDKEDHQWILDSIETYREEVQKLAREATGDDGIEI